MAITPLHPESRSENAERPTLSNAVDCIDELGGDIKEAAALCYAVSQSELANAVGETLPNALRSITTLLEGIAQRAEAESERFTAACKAERFEQN